MSAKKYRSMSEGLSEPEREFLQTGKVKAVPSTSNAESVQNVSVSPVTVTKPAEESVPGEIRLNVGASRRPPALGHAGFRLPQDLLHELEIASFERKISGVEPFAKQDIAAEALREWLHRHRATKSLAT